jgi:hypothetical protein
LKVVGLICIYYCFEQSTEIVTKTNSSKLDKPILFRRDRKKYLERQKSEGIMSSTGGEAVASGGIQDSSSTQSTAIGVASLSIATEAESASTAQGSKKIPSSFPPLKGLNLLGCFDYTHYGHLKTPLLPDHKYLTEKTQALAIDCEMVGVGPLKEDALARVSVVNEFGYCLYDKFVKPKAQVTDYRTEFSGVREEDLKQGMVIMDMPI